MGCGCPHWQQSHHCGIETYTLGAEIPPVIMQQSHHCGIETTPAQFDTAAQGRQQSHHCGIETRRLVLYISLFNACSNRTIVGLKLLRCFVKTIQDVVQQSHHCGIET